MYVRRVTLTSYSARIVNCELDSQLSDFIIEPVKNFPGVSGWVVISRAFNSTGKSGNLCILNLS